MDDAGKKYPEIITDEMLVKQAHIPDADVERDIADTEAEIANYERLQKAEAEVARTHPNEGERRMAHFRARARPSQIAERQAFVDFLRRLLAARKEAAHV